MHMQDLDRAANSRRESLDATLFYYLESWVVSLEEPSTTTYLSRFEIFQRHMTAAAYKLAAGAEPTPHPSSAIPTLSQQKSRQQKFTVVPQVFVNKIAQSFIDALYAFLDGLVLLASEESPIVKEPDKMQRLKGTESVVEMRLHEMLDLKDAVSS